MMPDLSFLLSVAALLSVPGPTNTLLAAGGAGGGLRRALVLVPAEMAGYLVSIGLLCLAAGPVVAAHPAMLVATRMIAALYIAVSAVGLWRPTAATAGVVAPIHPHKVFTATLLNPKGLIFAFVIFPQGDLAALPGAFGLFAAELALIGTLWVVMGHVLAKAAGRFATPLGISRSAAVALGVFSALLFGSALAAMA